MDSKQFVETALRDAVLVEALQSAILAMALTHGASIQLDGISGRLNFQRELAKLCHALALLGVDMTEQFPEPCRRRERR